MTDNARPLPQQSRGRSLPTDRQGDEPRQRGSTQRAARTEPIEVSARQPTPARWPVGDGDADDTRAAGVLGDEAAELVNLGFFRAALRRGRHVWVALAVLGLLVGVASSTLHPPGSSATTTFLLAVGPEAQPGTAILNDQAIAQSRGVAAIARHELGLRTSIDGLLATYTATVVTDRIMRITVTAPSSHEAVRRANAIGSAFLTFRAQQLRAQQRLQAAALSAVVEQSEQRVRAIEARIAQVAAQPRSPSQRSQLSTLRASADRARSALSVLKTQVDDADATSQDTTAAMIGQSAVLDAASPVAHSRFKPLILSGLVGLLIGLIVGVSLIVVRALVSDRLRRRDDVAMALGAPVRVSIPAVPRLRRWFARLGGRAGRPGHGTDRGVAPVVALLRDALPDEQPAALAVVPVDDPRVAATSLIALADSLSATGARVVVADLCAGAPAARLVGVSTSGVHEARRDDTPLHVIVPDAAEVAPAGPFGTVSRTDRPAAADERATVCASADVVLTLLALDPASADDRLRTWAADAVVFVTAGRSSWTKVRAVGEMVRLAGARLVAAVLVGADRWDETLGSTVSPRPRPVATRLAGDGAGEPREPSDTAVV